MHVDAEHLAAYLDGELSPGRAAAIAAALEQDAGLRAQHDAAMQLDASWRVAARSAGFQPTVRLPNASGWDMPSVAIAALILCLVLVRLTPGVSDPTPMGFLLHGGVLVIVLMWIVRVTRATSSIVTP